MIHRKKQLSQQNIIFLSLKQEERLMIHFEIYLINLTLYDKNFTYEGLEPLKPWIFLR